MTTMQTVPYVSNTPLVSAEAFTLVDNHSTRRRQFMARPACITTLVSLIQAAHL